ncbi:pleckstrin homology domain-containing family G member 1 [Trichomycterus rosablanca]|uniref:pleckstrin homology domain-containing family G member 1 n=1 Tax=Trichomycterus rosablanca TaxID=2290929 RepID=UPI002F3611C1
MPTEESLLPTDVIPPPLEVPTLEGTVLNRGTLRNPTLRYSSTHSMDSTQCSDRPVSYSSTSSSTSSSRDSHCSAVLGVVPEQNRDSGAIRLELVPARQLEEAEPPTQAGQDEERKVAYVDRVVQEILETERTYVQDLQSIVQDYLQCISNQTRPLLGVEDRNSLFGNIRDIYTFNRDLLNDLEGCNTDPVAIAQCFVVKSEEFHIYTQYCTNYPRSVAVLSECMRNKSVAKFLRERQEFAKHSLPLGSFLLKPVQRILKYHLLLQEIATHLEKQKDLERHAVVQEAIDSMQRVAWHINDMKRKHENTVRLQEIQSLLTSWQGPDLIGYGELVLEGTFRIQRVKNERTLFLFDKLLLITKKREETYAYKAHILCCNLMLVEVIPKEPLSFSVFHYKNPKLQHTVQAKSQQDKRTWIQHLKRLILENHPAKIPAKAKQAILEMDVHSPGLQRSPEGQNRINLKEGPSPRRGRRKTEPLSKLLKNKHAISSPDIQKRSSFGATLLSPVVHLGTIGRSRSLVNQSQESLDPGDHADHSDVDEGLHPQDADDEDESGLGSRGKLRVPGKGNRKRLNQQVSVDSIDQLKNHNLDHVDLQTAKESLQMDTVQTPILRVTCPPKTKTDEHISTLFGTNSIWADHNVRRAMFPTRQKSFQIEDDEDIYQMFVPNENNTSGHDAESDDNMIDDRQPGRPCSWHVEQVPSPQSDLQSSGGKVLRRASSVGEHQSDRQSPTKRPISNTDSSSNEISGSSSAEQLTIDDVENVYDNISYEELQAMGLIRKEPEVPSSVPEVKALVPPTILVSPVETEEKSSESNWSSGQEGVLLESTVVQAPEEEENIYDTIVFRGLPPSSAETAREDEQAVKQDSEPSCVSEESLNLDINKGANRPLPEIPIVSITDMDVSITFDTSSQQSTSDSMSEQVDEIWNDLEDYIRNNEKKPDKHPAAFPVSSPESPSKTRDPQSKTESSPNKPPSSPSKAVKSQHTQEESQQKTQSSPRKEAPNKKCNSGRKASDSRVKSPSDRPKKVKKSPSSSAPNTIPTFKLPVLSVPKLVREPTFEIDEPESPPLSPVTPEVVVSPAPNPEPQPGTVKSIRNKLARLSSGSFRMDDEDPPSPPPPPKDPELQVLFGGLDPSLLSLPPSGLFLDEEAGDQLLELGERGRNRVFLMARQYSQKIKKANQLLKMKSMDHEPSCTRLRTSKSKDLADILEEKKQGGAAIGARIAEYSHLYDQVMFKEPSSTPVLKSSASIAGPHPLFTHSSPSLPGSSSPEADWLNCTYSNGELAGFVSWPTEVTAQSFTPQRRLTPATSVPTLKNLPPAPSTPPNQRWSTCVSPTGGDEHIYSTLGPRSSKTPPYSRCRSSTSLAEVQEKENSGSVCNRGLERDASRLGLGPRQHSLPESTLQTTPDLSPSCDLTLRDSQQVLVLNKNAALNAVSARQNYLANFKDDDDDDDYVEIRSEDEHDDRNGNLQPGPDKSWTVSPDSALHDYVWNGTNGGQTAPGQSKIVHSVRERFQCLGSSSFA